MIKSEIRLRIIELEVEHRDLDSVIDALSQNHLQEDMYLRRLKKRRLKLKDQIMHLKMQLIPDILA